MAMLAFRTQRGLTLIEVLIALVVMSVGILGLLTLQTGSLRASHEAQFRTVASVNAQSFGEMIALHGAVRDADRIALQGVLNDLLPSPELTVEPLTGNPDGIDRFLIRIAWDGRDDERNTLRYVATLEAAP